MPRFQRIKREDVRGPEGVIFSDGAAVLHWCVPPYSTRFYSSIDDLIQVHGREGRTTLQVSDQAIPAEFARV